MGGGAGKQLSVEDTVRAKTSGGGAKGAGKKVGGGGKVGGGEEGGELCKSSYT